MSLTKIEYPTLESTRTAVVSTHAKYEIQERRELNTVVFFRVKPNRNLNELQVVGIWSDTKNFGIVYDNID